MDSKISAVSYKLAGSDGVERTIDSFNMGSGEFATYTGSVLLRWGVGIPGLEDCRTLLERAIDRGLFA